MTYFNPAFLTFFTGLSKNNNTTWFNQNRKTYETEVKEPFRTFVEELIDRAGVNIKAADCIFRINKDIRFSKDKTPYNTHVSANISPFGRKNKEYPGLYVQLGADRIMIVGGAYLVEKDSLLRIRKTIAKDPVAFEKLLSAPSFKKKFGTIKGEKNKVLPPEFKAMAVRHPLIANKSFYYAAELDAKEVLSPKLADSVMQYNEAGKPVSEYLIKALKK
jgi:uncharacterized protein (TIGR02453 family)